MKKFNLSAWALAHPQLIVFLMLFVMITGAQSYLKLGRSEEPNFTIKVMIVRTMWPGATAREVELQVTERIEKRLQTIRWLDHLRSYSRAGESSIFIMLHDAAPPDAVPEIWQQVRRKLDDIKPELPEGTLGPFPNDEFGDVYVNIFALTGDGVAPAELRRQADRFARELRRVRDVKKVDLFGVQHEQIYVDIDTARLPRLGLTPQALIQVIRQQNQTQPSGFLETDADRIQMRVTGNYQTVEQVRQTTIEINGRRLRLGDIAEVHRGYVEPPDPLMRVAGKDAVGIGVAMEAGGDVIALGRNVQARLAELKADTPRGVEFHTIANQPEDVFVSINLFVRSLLEAVLIVLVVSFVSLGWRTGMVVALSIPLVLAATFLAMRLFGIDLHLISLGALIIALGLLVDDAIIAVEMMVVKIEQGWDKLKAATFAYTSTAMPMLFGTLIMAAAFMPVGLAESASAEYAGGMFWVVMLAVLISWVVAVLFTPYIGYRILDVDALRAKVNGHGDAIYDTRFYLKLRSVIDWCLRHRRRVIAATAASFFGAIVLFATAVENQFFPSSAHREVIVHLWLPEGSSIKATQAVAQSFERHIAKDPAVKHYAGYIGSGSPRFILGQNVQLQYTNFAEYIVMAKDKVSRDQFRERMKVLFDDANGDFAGVRARTQILRHGPPVDYPVEFRLSGDDLPTLRRYAEEMTNAIRQNPHVRDPHVNWSNLAKSVRVMVDYDKAHALGVTRENIAQTLQVVLNGAPITQVHEGDQLIDITWRGSQDLRRADALADILVPSASGRAIPLAQLARLDPVMEEAVIWRWDRQASLLLQVEVAGNIQGPTVTAQLMPLLQPIIDKLPPGYHFEIAGMAESSAKGEEPIMEILPWVGFLIAALLMIQLQSFSLTALVMLTAPLGMIGVALALTLTRMPFGFVAMLGTIALAGMVMRNSVILVDQIRQDVEAGKHLWEAIVDSTVRRFRPIVLTAAAAILAMIPLLTNTMYGPMAVAIMGGLVIATALTCLFLPALYAAWYRVRPPA
ncbi:MAG: efflux RND transporter permease subunit [Steroidobacteraceae bacterium]